MNTIKTSLTIANAEPTKANTSIMTKNRNSNSIGNLTDDEEATLLNENATDDENMIRYANPFNMDRTMNPDYYIAISVVQNTHTATQTDNDTKNNSQQRQ